MPSPGSRPSPDDTWACDLLVVGAGPAGSAAAIEASRSGLDTVVLDKARFPRDKCCGDGLTTGALRHLEALGIEPGRLPSWTAIPEIHVVGPDGRSIHFPLPTGPGIHAAVCRRRELDAALVDLARQAGAAVLEGHTLTAVRPSESGVEAEAGGIRFQARYLVAADGMWSPTRRLLGLQEPGYRGEWHAFRQYLTNVTGPAATELLVWFEPDLLPGYAWSFPVGGGAANVGFGIQRASGYGIQAMGRTWPDLLRRPHIAAALGPDAKPEAPHRAWPIPANLPRAHLAQGRVLFVGDAATATDPMTGEGIGQALETGRLAARSIVQAGIHRPEAVIERYRRELARGMVADHRLAGVLSRVLERPRAASAAITVAGCHPWTRKNFGRWLFEDYPRAQILTPRRWHRGGLGGPGAFASVTTPAG